MSALFISQFTRRIISLGAFTPRFSGSKSSWDFRERTGPGRCVRRIRSLAKHEYSKLDSIGRKISRIAALTILCPNGYEMILAKCSMQDQCCTKSLWPQIERRSLLSPNVNLQSYRGDFRRQKKTLQAQLVGVARSRAVIKPHVQRENPQPLRI